MAFTGTYELQSHENFEAFMIAMGAPKLIAKKAKDAKIKTKIVQDGDHFVITVNIGPKVQRNEFNLGEETELVTIRGEKIKTTMNMEDGKLVSHFNGFTHVIELSGDLLINVMTNNDIVYKRISKRVS
ncbi:fatty acid-binding protein, liver-like [Hyperolius riggenbachi]|uniref:fatty acid-binding protein, liver-like n=1 Tax=Hyperolius riggenbachi TaxID=752182 RepID=UPI0035A306CB